MGYSPGVRIRCERCATTYELDERRLPTHGALVKCTRCDHVFRAAPPAAAEARGAGPTRADEPGSSGEKTALFGFGRSAAEETTASIASAPPPALMPADGAERHAPPAPRPPARPAGGRAAAAGARQVWPWVLLAALLAAAIVAGGVYLAQRNAATPTTRLPAGAELFPT
jgi:predicted Zn finger-like uncharacterized protein